MKAKQVRAKLGEVNNLLTIGQAHKQSAKSVVDRLSEVKTGEERKAREKQQHLTAEEEKLRKQQYAERLALAGLQVQRFWEEEANRQARLRKRNTRFV